MHKYNTRATSKIRNWLNNKRQDQTQAFFSTPTPLLLGDVDPTSTVSYNGDHVVLQNPESGTNLKMS